MLNLFNFPTFSAQLLYSICPRSAAILVYPNEKFCQIPANILNGSELKFAISSHYTLCTRLPMLFSHLFSHKIFPQRTLVQF